MDFEKCRLAFDEYTDYYDKSQKEISLKYHHSYAVSNLMAELAFRLDLSKEEIILAKVIGLLHDIGRFEEVRKNGGFLDIKIDHATESCDYLFEQGHIREFVDSRKYDSIIKNAIIYHNKLNLPKLKGKELLFCQMVRDMDKVDIYKQLAAHYHFSFDVEKINKGVLESFKDKKLVNKIDIKTNSDEVLLYLSYIFDINFEESFDILVNTDNFDLFLSTIEIESNSEKLWKKIREICFSKINQGIKGEKG